MIVEGEEGESLFVRVEALAYRTSHFFEFQFLKFNNKSIIQYYYIEFKLYINEWYLIPVFELHFQIYKSIF